MEGRQSQRRHHGAKVGAADPYVDDIGKGALIGGANVALSDALTEFPHAV